MKIHFAFAASLAMLTAAAVSVAVSPVTARPQQSPGIGLGAKAPLSLALRDSAGKPTNLAKQMGAKGVMVVLVRSADWCPYCKVQLSELNAVQPKLAAMGYRLVSVSYDKPAKLSAFAKAKAINFTMLSDQGSKMIDALSLRDPQYSAVPFANGVPYASILLLGKDGTVKAKNVSLDYTVRPSNAQVLAMASGG
jgi:peroxiredoxin